MCENATRWHYGVQPRATRNDGLRCAFSGPTFRPYPNSIGSDRNDVRAALAHFYTPARRSLAALDAARRSEVAAKLRPGDGAPVGALPRVVLLC
jgi:hypothetical protein